MSDRIRRLPVLVLLLACLFLAPASIGQGRDSQGRDNQGHHGEGHEKLHHWYLTLRDWKGEPCCNGQDCRPTISRRRNQRLEVLVDGEWAWVPRYKILPGSSPDLRDHVCAPSRNSNYPRGHIFCVVLGAGV